MIDINFSRITNDQLTLIDKKLVDDLFLSAGSTCDTSDMTEVTTLWLSSGSTCDISRMKKLTDITILAGFLDLTNNTSLKFCDIGFDAWVTYKHTTSCDHTLYMETELLDWLWIRENITFGVKVFMHKILFEDEADMILTKLYFGIVR